jgi:hypothetical protein
MTGPDDDVSDYEVSPAALDAAAAGIEAVLEELRVLGPVGSAEEGRGVERLAALPGDVAQAGLSTAFVVFCNRWEWGVRGAVQAGRDVAEGLRAAGVAYGHADGRGEDLLAWVAYDLVGDPGGAGGTWADVTASAAPNWRMPEWSELAAPWVATGRDLVEHSLPAMAERVLGGTGALDVPFDDLRPIAQ